jgi:F0F1-type ATP synthase assembly protein I
VNFFTRYAILSRFWLEQRRLLDAMPEDESGSFIGRSFQYFQETVRSSGPAASASYALIGAIILFGGIGYAFDVWRATSPWGLLIGLLLGLIVGFYELAKAVWRQ